MKPVDADGAEGGKAETSHAEGDAHGASKAKYSFIYLASQSPRRRQLLDQIGVRHELLLPGDDEDAEGLEAERAGELPADYVERVTRST